MILGTSIGVVWDINVPSLKCLTHSFKIASEVVPFLVQ